MTDQGDNVRHLASSPLAPALKMEEAAETLRRLADAAEAGHLRAIAVTAIDRAEAIERHHEAQREADTHRLAGILSEMQWLMWAERNSEDKP